MSDPRLEEVLDSALATYLEGWGSLPWRELIADVRPQPDPELAAMLFGLSGIEVDADYMQAKLRHAGLLRRPQLRTFNAVWMVEELDHSRALRALYELYSTGEPEVTVRHGTFGRDRRSILAVPTLHVVGRYRSAMLASYFIQGAFTEYIAITIYRGLGRLIGDPAAAEILGQMAAQEGRHLRFYRTGAEAVLGAHRHAPAFVRFVAEHTWRPPGVDLYGQAGWERRFAPLLDDGEVRERLLRMDRFFAVLPGLDDMHAMSTFLERLDPGADRDQLARGMSRVHEVV